MPVGHKIMSQLSEGISATQPIPVSCTVTVYNNFLIDITTSNFRFTLVTSWSKNAIGETFYTLEHLHFLINLILFVRKKRRECISKILFFSCTWQSEGKAPCIWITVVNVTLFSLPESSVLTLAVSLCRVCSSLTQNTSSSSTGQGLRTSPAPAP